MQKISGLKQNLDSRLTEWCIGQTKGIYNHEHLTGGNEIRNLPAFKAETWVPDYTVTNYTGMEYAMQSYFPTLGFGTGNEMYAHAPNERIPVEHLHKAVAFYAEFVRNF